jgi:proton-translocating NADH-quinone oxidoreductase chain L
MILLPLYLTLSSFLCSLLGGKWIGIKGACMITVVNVILSAIVSLILWLSGVESQVEPLRWMWFDMVDVSYVFQYDSLTYSMLVVVTVVSSCAHLYSVEYMDGDPHQVRFMGYLSLFTFFMLILVTAGNLVQLFIGWEGVGICSYLLINFWYTRVKATKSAMMAVIVNKVGDVCFLIGLGLIYGTFKSFDFHLLNSVSLAFDVQVTAALVFFILGAVGKSAQLGLHMWLPEAMEGPTPVSSLIHAATMVTAGIFLMMRLSYLLSLSNVAMVWIVFFGSLTTLFASTVGLFQNDLKKVIAYSTCSQLGYMFLGCGLNGFHFSFFHLFNHAFFKALLFLTAGYIIHSFLGEQDMRKMGGVVKLLPFPYVMILVSSLSLLGFPFLSGFYSKEKILELFMVQFANNSDGLVSLFSFYSLVAHLALIFTIAYSMRLLYYSFYSSFRGFSLSFHYGHWKMISPLLLLFVLSVASGYVFKDLMIGVGTDYWSKALWLKSYDFVYYPYEFNSYYRNVTLFWVFYYTFGFTALFFVFNRLIFSWKLVFYPIFFALTEKYVYVNKFYEWLSQVTVSVSGKWFYYRLDKGFYEWFGPYGVSILWQWAAMNYDRVSSKYLLFSLYYVILGLLFFLWFF